ncbi:hypothetical protein HWV62_30987 [Athelia sp. TMB]|nr:hypothetical protein HWV62_30987 [Athelia sp. TMB]
MLCLPFLSLLLLLASGCLAIEILSPVENAVWTSAGPNWLVWQNQTGDFSSFNIQLVQSNLSAFIPSAAITANGILATRVPASLLSYSITPSCMPDGIDMGTRLPVGNGFTLRLIPADQAGTEVMEALAVSQPFDIVERNATSCEAAPTSSSSATISTGTAIPAGGLSTPSPSHIKAIVGGVIGGVMAIILALLALGCWFWKLRRDTRRKTVEFGIKMGHRMSMNGTQATLGPAAVKMESA